MIFATMHAIPHMNPRRWYALYLERARRSFSQLVKFDRSLRRAVAASRGRITARQIISGHYLQVRSGYCTLIQLSRCFSPKRRQPQAWHRFPHRD
jgi:hypothetical protein